MWSTPYSPVLNAYESMPIWGYDSMAFTADLRKPTDTIINYVIQENLSSQQFSVIYFRCKW